MDWTNFTIQILEVLKTVGGSYGMAIVLLTILVRLVLFPLSISQQRSMKKMQELSPKLKQIQASYKDDPQKLQQKMMEFYKEHSFNPFGGCLPLIAQMPVLILLYTTLISVPFLQVAGSSSFLFIHRLDGTLQTHAGQTGDGKFSVEEKDRFVPAPSGIKVILSNGSSVKATIPDYGKALTSGPTPIKPGKPVAMVIPDSFIMLEDPQITDKQFKEAVIPVINDITKEIEVLTFTYRPNKHWFAARVDTIPGKNKFNIDAFVLLALFAATMYWSQKIMTATSSATMDPQQKAMQETMSKMMPIMILAMFVIIPIPAGVLLYMVVSNVITFGQTYGINKWLDMEEAKKKSAITQCTEEDLKLKSAQQTDTDQKAIDVKAIKPNSIKSKRSKKGRRKGHKFIL